MSKKQQSKYEFVALMALLMSLVALTIDAMLPAISQIGQDLGVVNPNHNQYIVSAVFIGMSLGLMLFGPLSDAHGRKKSVFIGLSIFAIGCAVSIFTDSFAIMILGRILQGFGAAAPRVLTLSMTRDKYEGAEMAKIVSMSLVLFMLVPALAPALGQVILYVSGWRSIFVLLLFVGIVGALWLAYRQEETLKEEYRKIFSLKNFIAGSVETLKHPIVLGYTLAAGIISGSFIGYLSSVQQIIQIQYKQGELFSIYFGSLAIAIGLASFTNTRLVTKYKMEQLCSVALAILVGLSAIFFLYTLSYNGHPPLVSLITFLMLLFFCFGILFGNYSSLAINPMGHIAGVATSVITSIQTLMSVLIGGYIGYLYDGTITPLITGFLVSGILSFIVTTITSRISLEH